jgi:F0F1-type ATP synthase membrane subunit b/b'
MLEFPPNVTALIQAALFVALWVILKPVFERFLANLSERERRTSGAVAEARRLRDEAASLRTEYEGLLANVKREAVRAKDEIRQQAERDGRDLLDGARRDAERILSEIRSRVAHEVSEARAGLERDAEAISDRVVAAFLGRRG